MKPTALSFDGLRDALRGLPDNGLAGIREAALERLSDEGLPTTKHEDWKYTDLSAAIDISNRWLLAGRAASAPAIEDDIAEITRSIDAVWLVLTDGDIAERYLRSASEHGIAVSRLSEVPEAIASERPLTQLNAALLRDGLSISVSGQLDKPIGLLFVDRAAGAAAVSQNRVDLRLEAGARAQVIEYHSSAGDADHYANAVLRIAVGAGAALDHVRLQNRAAGHVQTTLTEIRMGRDSRLHMAGFDLGGGLVRNDLAIDLAEPGSEVVFDGLYLAGDGQHIDNHTRVDHRVGPAVSRQEYRGILNGKCRCVWNGKAIVHEGADGTDANQANHNLLLSEKAEIDAKPELEIYAEDVKCSHGTTVGQLDDAALFYLRTRGLSRQLATQVLTHAFAADLVARIPIDAARDTVSAIVESRLAGLIGSQAAAEAAS